MNNIYSKIKKWRFVIPFILALFLVSCEEYDDYTPVGKDAALSLSTKDTSLVLKQMGALRTNAINFSWTTGTTHGTGANISYELQIDVEGNNFAQAWSFDMGKANYSKSILVSELNKNLLQKWGAVPGNPFKLESRIVATISTTPSTQDFSAVVRISVTPYLPVTEELYMIGDATPAGWNIAGATAMTRDVKEEGIFVYQGALKVGKFKLPVNKNTDWAQDMYMRDPLSSDSSKMYLHKGGEADDVQWEVKTAGMYKVTVNLYDLTIKMESAKGASVDKLYMVGDATSIGWDIANAVEMVKDPNSPAVFKYDGMLKSGEFKFPVNRDANWGQDMFMRSPDDSSKIYMHNGGDPDDNKWKVSKEGWYSIRLDVENNTISINRLEKLYIIGSATPVGWNIGEAIEMTAEPSGYEFTYTGALGEGEFKFPVDRSSSWGQDMFMKDPADAGSVYHHVGGEADDSKWTLTTAEAGNYKVTVNLKTMKISMTRQ